jgi:DMSO/TMAO reductase YedYZ molybdopterin-dependent catalytic subunit
VLKLKYFFLWGVIALMLMASSCHQNVTSSVITELPNADNSTQVASLTSSPIYSLNITSSVFDKEVAQYRLVINGLVNTPLSLTYESILAFPTVTASLWLVCPGFFEEYNEWTGVPVSTLLMEAGLKPEATKVIFHASDGYEREFSLEYALQDGFFLAYMVDGHTMSLDEGYPLRLITTREAGSDWVRWVDNIKII